MKVKNKKIVLIFTIILLTLISIVLKGYISNNEQQINKNKTYSITKTYALNTKEQTDNMYKAIQEVAYSYYMRGTNIQYNSMKGNPSWFSPEETTSQNMNYLVCSAFAKNVYYELLGIKIPPYTESLLKYSREHIGSPEVIAYGNKENSNFVMKIYDESAENKYKELINPSLKDIIPYLKIRRRINVYRTHCYGI